MAQTVGDMEADGLIERNPDPGDRRRALVSLTDAGRARIEESRHDRVGWLAGERRSKACRPRTRRR